MALTAAYFPPGVEIVDGYLLYTATGERVFEVALERHRLVPRILRVSQEHSKKVARTGLISLAIRCTSVHDA